MRHDYPGVSNLEIDPNSIDNYPMLGDRDGRIGEDKQY